MKFTKKNKIILLLFLAIINIAIRLPVTAHAIGTDTFFIFSLAESIATFGYAKWIIHPASFFGLYPYSYPSGFIFSLSGISQITGISLEYTILISGMLFAIFCAISMYLLAEEFFKNDLYAFLAAFAISFSSNFLKFSLWSASTRILFIVLLPFFIWILIRFRNSKILFLFGTVFLIILVSSHRLFMFLPLIIFVYIACILIEWLSNRMRLKPKINPAVLQVHIFYILSILSLILFIIPFFKIGPFDLGDYQEGYFLKGNDFLSVYLNLAADYTSSIGIVLFFILPGFIILILKINKNFSERFILLVSLFFLPLLGFENYSPLFIAPFLILISLVGFSKILNIIYTKKQILGKLFLSSFMFLSIVLAFFMINHWDVYGLAVSESTVNSAQFIKNKSNGTVISNNGDHSQKITSYSSVPAIPLGGPHVLSYPPGQVVYGFADTQKLITRKLTLSEWSPNVDELWIALNAEASINDWAGIMLGDISKTGTINLLSKYNAHLFIETGPPGTYVYWFTKYAHGVVTIDKSQNMIFNNGNEKMYYLMY